MNEIADRVLKTYELIGELDAGPWHAARERGSFNIWTSSPLLGTRILDRVVRICTSVLKGGCTKDRTHDLPDASRGGLVCEIG